MPRGEFNFRYWFLADAPNIARNCRVTKVSKYPMDRFFLVNILSSDILDKTPKNTFYPKLGVFSAIFDKYN